MYIYCENIQIFGHILKLMIVILVNLELLMNLINTCIKVREYLNFIDFTLKLVLIIKK